MFSIKSKVLAATRDADPGGRYRCRVAAARHLGGNPELRAGCVDIFNKQFGTYPHPGFILDTLRQGIKVGQPQILFRQSNSDPAEDYTFSYQGNVSNFWAAGLMSPTMALHYGCSNGFVSGTQIKCSVNPITGKPSAVDDFAFEIQYAPFGVDSGLCMGLASAAVSGEKVSLQPCGASSKTVWVMDTLDSCYTNPLYSDELQLINGSNTNFSLPDVLTYSASAYPTDIPRPQLYVTGLTGFSQTGGTGSSAACGGSAVTGPDTNQLWGADLGVLP